MLIDMQNHNEVVVDFIIHTYDKADDVLKNREKNETIQKDQEEKTISEVDLKKEEKEKKKQKYENDDEHSMIM